MAERIDHITMKLPRSTLGELRAALAAVEDIPDHAVVTMSSIFSHIPVHTFGLQIPREAKSGGGSGG